MVGGTARVVLLASLVLLSSVVVPAAATQDDGSIERQGLGGERVAAADSNVQERSSTVEPPSGNGTDRSVRPRGAGGMAIRFPDLPGFECASECRTVNDTTLALSGSSGLIVADEFRDGDLAEYSHGGGFSIVEVGKGDDRSARSTDDATLDRDLPANVSRFQYRATVGFFDEVDRAPPHDAQSINRLYGANGTNVNVVLDYGSSELRLDYTYANGTRIRVTESVDVSKSTWYDVSLVATEDGFRAWYVNHSDPSDTGSLSLAVDPAGSFRSVRLGQDYVTVDGWRIVTGASMQEVTNWTLPASDIPENGSVDVAHRTTGETGAFAAVVARGADGEVVREPLRVGPEGWIETSLGLSDLSGDVEMSVLLRNADSTLRGFVVGEDDGADGPVERADTDGDGGIDDDELRAAIVGWSSGEYSDAALRSIVVAWSTS